jgi:hypothetical protein
MLVMVLPSSRNDWTMGMAREAREPGRADRDIPIGVNREIPTGNELKLLVGEDIVSDVLGIAIKHCRLLLRERAKSPLRYDE